MIPLPAWNRRNNFGIVGHRRNREAINQTANLAPATPGIDVYSTFTSRGLFDHRAPSSRLFLHKIVLTAATVVGGLYECNVYDPASRVRLNMSAGPVPTTYYGTRNLDGSGNPVSGTTFYALNNAESNMAQWTLLSNTRGPFAAYFTGDTASDGTRILEMVSEFTASACSTAMTLSEMQSM